MIATSVLDVERISGTRAVRAENLKPHHVGRRFAGIGILQGFVTSDCCVEMIGSATNLTVDRRFRLAYFIGERAF